MFLFMKDRYINIDELYLIYLNIRLNILLILINITTFHFSLSRIFIRVLVLQKISVHTFGPYF